ncbi:31452_t:CDS:2 [Gigaspora margarita]|uniref:31452_t:CDS:1 n=1 Tax=Gigaspora margarita TaxID=4874 RepID=A0ABN7VT38_GIGMA|nr:31452_t:CDS:2 [Gigaspora margarita]
MSEQSTPTSAATTSSEKPVPTLAEFVRKYDTEQLIKFLRENDLQLNDAHFEILRNEEVNGRAFLNSTKQDFIDYGLKGGPAKMLTDFAKEVKEKKLKSFSSCKTKQEVKEVFNKFGYEDADITSILPFKPETVDIDSNDKDLKYCVTDLKRNIRLYGSASEINEAERCHYISSIIHASIHIARKITNKTIIPKCQFEIIGDERTGRVDYAVKVKDNIGNEELIAITEAKQSDVLMGFRQNVLQLTASHHKNSKKRNAEEAFGKDAFDYLYGIVTTVLPFKKRYSIDIDESALEDDSRFCQDVKKVVQASLVETQNGKEVMPEVRLSIDNSVSAVDLSNSVVAQQNNADTKSIEGVPDKGIDDFIPEEPVPKHTNTNECQKVIGITKSNAHVTKSSEVSISIPITQVSNSSGAVTSSLHEITPSLPLSHTSNSEDKIGEDNKSSPETVPEKEILIRNESDIDALILLLQQKFKMSKKILDKWKADIVFEFRDNTKYWKKERESMPEADFLEYKKNFEAKMGVPTTPHKNELKNKSLALIEYA